MVARQSTDITLYTGSNVLVYLIHGVTGTPAEMHYLARGLARNNWDVYVTTLPGHCTRLRDLVRTGHRDWHAHVQAQLAFARERYDFVFAAGLSVGGLLALEASTVVDIDGIGVLSPTIVYDGWNTPVTLSLLPLAMKLVPRFFQRFLFHVDGPPFGIKDETIQAQVREAYRPTTILRDWVSDWWAQWTVRQNENGNRRRSSASKGYPIFPLKTFADIHQVINQVCGKFGAVEVPTVILQAQEDDMTSPRNAHLVYDGIASKQKRLILLDDCYHVITVDKQRHFVLAHLIEFFRLQMAAPAGDPVVEAR